MAERSKDSTVISDISWVDFVRKTSDACSVSSSTFHTRTDHEVDLAQGGDGPVAAAAIRVEEKQ